MKGPSVLRSGSTPGLADRSIGCDVNRNARAFSLTAKGHAMIAALDGVVDAVSKQQEKQAVGAAVPRCNNTTI